RISASQVAILSVLEPVTTLVVGMLFMHESSSILQILGVFLLLFSAVMIQMVSQPNQIVIES
ncbi:MAG: EamA family transporter, partial [Gammaproteobacteria bacterium]